MTSTTPEPRTLAHAGSSQWTYLTNHAHVLLAIARDHDVRLREIASQVGITERAVQKIIAELEDAGALTKSRDGRRNHYEVNTEVSLRHPMEAHRTLNSLVRMVLDDATPASDDVGYLSSGNGHSNGHANGHTNGHSNGYSNGLANGRLMGLTNGHANGHANGHSNGHANGHSNGLGYANGLTNGHSNGNSSSNGSLA